MTPLRFLLLIGCVWFSLGSAALAYVDPGTAGVLFQLGYVVFYGIIGAFAFLGAPFKWLKRKLGFAAEEEEEEEDDDEEEDEVAQHQDSEAETSDDSSQEKIPAEQATS